MTARGEGSGTDVGRGDGEGSGTDVGHRDGGPSGTDVGRVVLSAGSNMGDPLAHLRSVVDGLGPRLTACSPVYVTAPWGGVEQADFHNITVLAESDDLDGWGWLALCRELEERAERVRDVRWGPRSLDVDVIALRRGGAEVRSDDPELILPHPRAHLRAFVLVPWLDVDPDATLGETPVREVVAALPGDEVRGVRGTSLGPGWAGLRRLPDGSLARLGVGGAGPGVQGGSGGFPPDVRSAGGGPP